MWENLSSALAEEETRLIRSRDFHKVRLKNICVCLTRVLILIFPCSIFLAMSRTCTCPQMVDQVAQTLPQWLHPVKDLHRNPASVTLLVKEIQARREKMMQELSRCHSELAPLLVRCTQETRYFAADAASSLLERLHHPLLEDALSKELNEPTRMAVGYLQGHIEWLAEKRRALPSRINEQLKALDVFSRQLAHEQYIEEVMS